MKASLLTFLITVALIWWHIFEPNEMLDNPPFCSFIIFFQYWKSWLSSQINNRTLSMGLMYITSSIIYRRSFRELRSYPSCLIGESIVPNSASFVSRNRSDRLVLPMIDWRLLLFYLSDSKWLMALRQIVYNNTVGDVLFWIILFRK